MRSAVNEKELTVIAVGTYGSYFILAHCMSTSSKPASKKHIAKLPGLLCGRSWDLTADSLLSSFLSLLTAIGRSDLGEDGHGGRVASSPQCRRSLCHLRQ